MKSQKSRQSVYRVGNVIFWGIPRTTTVHVLKISNCYYRPQTKFTKVMFLAALLLKQSAAYLVCHVYGCM